MDEGFGGFVLFVVLVFRLGCVFDTCKLVSFEYWIVIVWGSIIAML